MGRVSKGVECSIKGCSGQAERSISRDIFEKSKVGLELKEGVGDRVYLCKTHYKEFKKSYRKNVWRIERFSR
ncbi:hypothetical protein [Thermofilum pendens]|uniref:Uncharacterized protein n=1 Tax=Thermofilum pendens (strain DSM 2475 / Hrk 5) TaxID=368408 RepID=A1RWX7_THEPD|nr:hypothetical protein [Thermofilum pendens]ABL77707.1 hypothetical protein Tpen_0297 [Thermofilum pendens Hrk 5]